MAVDLVTQAEYARHRQVSREAVRKAVASNRITTVEQNGRRLIDPAVADIQWAANTDQKQFERANRKKIDAAGLAAGSVPAAARDPCFAARARREAAEAALAEIRQAALRAALDGLALSGRDSAG